MRLVDAAPRALAVAILIAGSVPAAEPQYGKVETFEPGKKYTCVPTADHKGWDCKEAAPKDGSPASTHAAARRNRHQTRRHLRHRPLPCHRQAPRPSQRLFHRPALLRRRRRIRPRKRRATRACRRICARRVRLPRTRRLLRLPDRRVQSLPLRLRRRRSLHLRAQHQRCRNRCRQPQALQLPQQYRLQRRSPNNARRTPLPRLSLMHHLRHSA